MLDRGIIKWQPFNSCFDSKQIIRDVTANKNRINLPVLSDDQIHILEEKTINAYNLKMNIHLLYYYDGAIKELNGKISYLDINSRKIVLNNISVYFSQIIKINELNF